MFTQQILGTSEAQNQINTPKPIKTDKTQKNIKKIRFTAKKSTKNKKHRQEYRSSVFIYNKK